MLLAPSHPATPNPEAAMSPHRRAAVVALSLLGPALSALAAQAPPAPPLDSTLLAGFRWRNVGPANVGGGVSRVGGIPSPSNTLFVRGAAGVLWNTTKPGTAFQPVLHSVRSLSV